MSYFYSKGFTLIEAVVAIAISAVILVGLSSVFNLALQSALANTAKIQASYLEEEGLEAMRLLRDNSWSANIAPQASGAGFFLIFNAGIWQITDTDTKVDGVFERRVTLEDVYRNSAQDIVSAGGIPDPNTRKVAVTVSWLERGAVITKSLSTYLTNVFHN